MKKKIFLSGATGSFGIEVLKELLRRKNKFEITVLVYPDKKNKKIIKKFEKHTNLKIFYGDITNYYNVLDCVEGMDYVVHLAALIPPAADYAPVRAERVNYGGTMNILRAIRNQPNRDELKLIYIGTIAEYGDRMPPLHWGRVGDPVIPSVYDFYGTTKIKAEMAVINSGLHYWVSLRQTAMLHFGLLDIKDGLMFHQPLNTHVEWVSAQDSGKLIANAVDYNLPDKFWRNVYNIGGGEGMRTTNYNYLMDTYKLIGIKDFTKVTEPNWFALRNFHCMWFLDSDILNNYLCFRNDNLSTFEMKLNKRISIPLKLTKIMTKRFIKNKIMSPIANTLNSPTSWVKLNMMGRVNAFFVSKKEWMDIPSWDEFKIIKGGSPIMLNHGYDESKALNELTMQDIKIAAEYRGGKFLSDNIDGKDIHVPLEWECCQGHKFNASLYAVLKAGHWCEHCLPIPWNYDEIAKKSKFHAQVWYNNHRKDEHPNYEYQYYLSGDGK